MGALRPGLTASTKHKILKGMHITKGPFLKMLAKMFDKKQKLVSIVIVNLAKQALYASFMSFGTKTQ